MINDLVKEYKNISSKILLELDKQGFLNLENLLSEKDVVLEKIKELNLESNEIKEILEKENILELDKKIIEKISIMKNESKEEMKKVSKQKQANTSYGNSQKRVQFLNVKL